MGTLGKLEPAALAQHADAVVARLEDDDVDVAWKALVALGKLEPAVLAQHAGAVVGKLNDDHEYVRKAAWNTLLALPVVITRDIDFESHTPLAHSLRERLQGRIVWYKCRLIMRARSLALYWYALPYRPRGAGYEPYVKGWDVLAGMP